MNDIKNVLRNSTNTWKNVYLLYKLSDFFVSVSDKDEDDDKEEKDDEEVIFFDNIEYEEEQEQEAIEEETHEVEENDTIKIVVVVIASLPYFPRKILMTTRMEIDSVGLTVTSTTNKSIQSFFAPIQLNTMLLK